MKNTLKVSETQRASESWRAWVSERAYDPNVMHLDPKIAAMTICEEFKFLTDLSIRSGMFATTWKQAKVLPAFKNKRSRYVAEFYRPLSNLFEVSKPTERAVLSQVYRYFEDCKLFHPNHHGFLRNHSTATAIQQILVNLSPSLQLSSTWAGG